MALGMVAVRFLYGRTFVEPGRRRGAFAIVVARFADVRDRACMPRLELFLFRDRDRVTCQWVKARYVAEIAARHSEWEIMGPPEVRIRRYGS